MARRLCRACLAPVASLTLIAFVAMSGEALANRMAVVIGNGNYAAVTPLKNPVNDATLLSEKLEKLDFEVLELTDLSEQALWPALDGFLARAEDPEIVLFYFSGHAFQLDDANYLVPVDARLGSVDAIATHTWSLNDIVARLEDLDTNIMVMLDACRNNPLPPSMRSMTGASGLARVETGADTKVMFATLPQTVAYEGAGDVSYFTQAVLDHIETENQSLDDLIRNVRNQVRTETVGRQIPWSGGNHSRSFYFKRTAEKRETLSEADIENLLLNFPPEQRPLILKKLAETVNLDLESIESRIASIEPRTNLSVLIEGDMLEPAPGPNDATRSVGSSPQIDVPALNPTVPDSPVPQRRPRDQPDDLAAGATSVSVLDPGDRTPVVLARVEPRRLDRVVSATVVSRASVPTLIVATAGDPVSIRGSEFWLDDAQRLAALLGAQPALKTAMATATLDGTALARLAQSELDRLGCYRDRVDGVWGRNSRFALTSYYLSKGIVFDDLEPSTALLRQLELEPRVICTGVEARAPRELARADVIAKPASDRIRAKPGTISTPVREEINIGKRTPVIRVR